MTSVLKITKDDFDSALDVATAVLKTGGIIIYPTDTVYGIGGDATNEQTVRKIRELKGIVGPKSLSVMVGDAGTIEYYCETGLWEDMILSNFLPGPYTFILKQQNNRPIPATENQKLGVRMPQNEFCQYLCQKFGKPIVSTSANITTEPAPVRFEDINKNLIENVDLAIDGGETTYKGPSLVIDLVEHKMLRKGAPDIDLIELPER